MKDFMELLADVNGKVNDFVWVQVGLILLIGTGLLTTIVTKVFQISHLKHWWTKTIVSVFKKDAQKKEAGSVSQFQALCTALAATIGTGNIAGVAAAIFLLLVVSGALMSSSIAWDISDTFNGMMMIPNLIGVVVLSYDAAVQKEMEEAVNNGEE